jgi:hypothetical protein
MRDHDVPERPSVKNLLKNGWRFKYSEGTRFVYAEHPRGGLFSVAEVCLSVRNDRHDVGRLIAESLNKQPV